MSAKIMFIHCLSPLHAGVGQGVDVVDLAIARDRATGFPYLPGSSIKGALRDQARHSDAGKMKELFGPEGDNASEHAGSLAFGDGNLLFLPTRSVKGTFAYVTSPYLLARLSRDLREAGLNGFAKIPSPSTNKVVVSGDTLVSNNKVFFEDLDLVVDSKDAANQIADELANLIFEDATQRDLFKKRFCIVHDDVMAFLSKHRTDVVTRVAIESDTKTVIQGQLWTEENLPSESILVSLVGHIQVKKGGVDADGAYAFLSQLTNHEVQFGGKATVGRGRTRVSLQGGK